MPRLTRKKRVPLLWTLLPHRGHSSAADRIALMQRYLALFPAASIRCLLADREFIGADWLDDLNESNVAFAIRLRGDLRVTDEAGHDLTLHARLHRARRGRSLRARVGARAETSGRPAGPLLNIAAKRLDGEWLIVVSNRPARAALDIYASAGPSSASLATPSPAALNMEDTRLASPKKLALLMAITALAMAWAQCTASRLLANRSPRRKARGFYEKSWFRTRIDELRNLLRTELTDMQSLCRAFQTRRVV